MTSISNRFRIALATGVATCVLLISSCDDRQETVARPMFVPLFGDVFPLPSDCELISWKQGVSLMCPGPTAIKYGFTEYESSRPWVEIHIGQFSEIAQAVNSKSGSHNMGKCLNLEILKMTLPIGHEARPLGTQLPEVIVVHDEQEYLTIVSSDDNIWRGMLREYSARLAAPPGTCEL